MATAPYSASAEYKAKVIAMVSADLSSFPKVLPDVVSATNVLSYHSLCVGASDLAVSAAFYARLGFSPVTDHRLPRSGCIRLRSAATGMMIDLVQTTDAPLPEGAAAAVAAATAALSEGQPPAPALKNVLMDAPGWKAPGHTHMSWSVASVPAVKAYLDSNGIALSGTRSTLAIFARDPDKTTLEFERNDGNDEAELFVGPESIGFGKKLDHVGVRIRAPYERHLDFWARTMGFNVLVNKYETNVEPLKNFAPWITRTMAGCDINFIPNCNSVAPPAGEASENALFEGGHVRAGILIVAYEIAEDAPTALAALRAIGVDAVLESELATAWPGIPSSVVLPFESSGATVLMKDLNGSIVRLVPRTQQ